MIPPVRPADQKIADFYAWLIENEGEYERSPAFQFYASDWLSSANTTMFDSDQQGWFIQLLARAWWNGDPQGTLPNDPDLLKVWCNYKRNLELNTARLRSVIRPLELTEEQMETALCYPLKWGAVLKLFKTVPGRPELIHNPKQTKILMEQFEYREQQKRASMAAVEAKRQKQGNKGVSTDRRPHEHRASSPSSSTSFNGLAGSPLPSAAMPLLAGLLGLEPSEPRLERVAPRQSNKGTKFTEHRFQINPEMRAWLQRKYPEFVEGDVEFMRERFCNTFAGKVKHDWARTFYNFVENEVIKYHYRPGQFDWRNKSQTNGNGGPKFNDRPELNAIAEAYRLKVQAEEEAALLAEAGDLPDTGEDSFPLLSVEDQ